MKKPSYLVVASSSCQMYSGTGRALFDFVSYARNKFDFTFLADVMHLKNFLIVQKFCTDMNIPLFVSRPFEQPGCIDSGASRLAGILSQAKYDFVECLSWANAAVCADILANIARIRYLVYTPHTQPIWTLPNAPRYFAVSHIFNKMLDKSEFIFIDSMEEKSNKGFECISEKKIHCLPLGVNEHKFKYESNIRLPYTIVSFCDCSEKRKRVDLMLKVFELAYQKNNKLRFVIGGKNSNHLLVPDKIKHAVTLLGYVDEEKLVRIYQQAQLFFLLTEYEAFGLPIAEALSCGTPVLVSKIPVLQNLFESLSGVYFAKHDDLSTIAQMIQNICSSHIEHQTIAQHAHDVFGFEYTYGLKTKILYDRFYGNSLA